MKLATFVEAGRTRVGALTPDGGLLDLGAAARQSGKVGAAVYDDMIALIAAGEPALEPVKAWLSQANDSRVYPLSSVKLKAPLPCPAQIRDLANYETHVRQAIAASLHLRAKANPDAPAPPASASEIPRVWYEQPLYYKANRFSVVGPGDDVIWPRFAKLMDYEMELAVVTRGPVRDLTEDNAMSAVFGYTIFNDFSARDMQSRETQFRLGPAKGKDFDTGNAFGPYIVTREEIADPATLTMIVRVNGVEKLHSVSGGMQHSLSRCLAHISDNETLYPGEIIGLGTVGNGCGHESLSFLQPGDVVELEVEGIGVLRNRIVKP